MKIICPTCQATRPNISKNGFFKRSSDSKKIQKYICKLCKKQFSTATFSDCYFQKKRRLNHPIKFDLCSSTSLRRIALKYRISRSTVKRKIEFLATQAKSKHKLWLEGTNFKNIEFDDLETFEHTKCKPISVSVAIESKTRKLIGFRVSSIGAKGHLAKPALKKYGKRENTSYKNRIDLFKELKKTVSPNAVFKTDMHRQYPDLIEKYFPKAEHRVFKSTRARSAGLGELKKKGFDPIFSINQVFAMLRDNLKRLTRQTWCTTKSIKYLEMQIMIYFDFHNTFLTK
jgi:transposase-like protein